MDKKLLKVLDEYNEEEIKELLIGRKVKADYENDTLILDNGLELEIIANRGCGGCNSGWYSITKLNEVDNAITDVQLVVDDDVVDTECDTTSYKIFVFCEDTRIQLLQVDGDDGNGWYGTGYEIYVRTKAEEK